MRVLPILALVAVSMLAPVACEGQDALAPTAFALVQSESKKVAAVSVTPDSMTLYVGDIGAATCSPRNQAGTPLANACAWTSSDTTVAQPTTGSQASSITARKKGSVRVLVSVSGKADTLPVVVLDTAVAPPPPPPPPPPPDSVGEQAFSADDFVGSISVQTHLDYPSYSNWSGIVKPRLLELGVRHIRQKMVTAEASKFQDLASHGIKLTAGCWPSGSNYSDASHCISDANAIGQNVIDAFDGWNEVDGGKVGTSWPGPWVQWETALWNAYNASATWKDRPLYANSLAHANSTTQLGNRGPIMDFGNMHSYPGGAGLPSSVSAVWIPNWLVVSGGKPLVVTETGYHSCPTCTNGVGVSVAAMGKLEPRILFEYFNRKVQRTNLYQLMDYGNSPTDREEHWGLLLPDGSPKPAFTAIKNIIGLLSDPGPSFAAGKLAYTLTGALASTHHTLLQKRDGRSYLVLWQEVKSYDTGTEKDLSPAADAVTLTLGTPASAIKVFLPRTGLAAIQPASSGATITLSVPDEILVVEVTP